jgi:hypothetical protein
MQIQFRATVLTPDNPISRIRFCFLTQVVPFQTEPVNKES